MEDIFDALCHPSELVVPCLLLLLGERSGHGYELVERLKGFGFAESGTGPVYRELRRLEGGGLVRSTWQVSQTRGPARRVYSLTPLGGKALARCVDGAAQLSETLDDFLGRAGAVSQPVVGAPAG